MFPEDLHVAVRIGSSRPSEKEIYGPATGDPPGNTQTTEESGDFYGRHGFPDSVLVRHFISSAFQAQKHAWSLLLVWHGLPAVKSGREFQHRDLRNQQFTQPPSTQEGLTQELPNVFLR